MDCQTLATVQFYAQQFYSRFPNLERTPQKAVIISLSPQECEVLKWCMAGKTKWEIGIILGVRKRC